MKNIFKSLTLVSIFAISGCESPEATAARETQFNGMTLAQVEAQIGAPSRTSPSKAVWRYSNSYVQRNPVYGYANGVRTLLYYSQNNVTDQCIFTATLNAGLIVASDYHGNSCRRFAPSLDN